jgi:uncharacterized protein (DUF2267 family)
MGDSGFTAFSASLSKTNALLHEIDEACAARAARMKRLVRTVLDILHRHYISEGELEDIRSSLPRELAAIVP